MSLKDISNFFGAISLQSVGTTQTDVNFIHHAFEILNDGVKSLSYGVKPLCDQSETNIAILIFISTSLERDCNFFMQYASCFTVKGESSNIMICMHCYYQWTQQTTRTNCISWCCLYYEKEISVLRLQSSQDTKCCFFWEEKTQTSPYLDFELLIRVSLPRKTLPIAFQSQGLCVCWYILVSLFMIPNSLNMTFSSANLSWYVWFYHIFIASKWKFSNYFFWLFCWWNKI